MSLPVTDRELLELAAKAYGIGPVIGRDDSFGLAIGPLARLRYWDPLTNLGDATRLLVKLRMTLICARTHTACDVPGTDEWVSVEAIDDAAACRVIVMAAAAVGRAMP